jgi:hypothetical protein
VGSTPTRFRQSLVDSVALIVPFGLLWGTKQVVLDPKWTPKKKEAGSSRVGLSLSRLIASVFHLKFETGRQSALAEAYGLYRMIHAEFSIGELRELIAVPPHIERVLRAYAKAHVKDAHWIEVCLKFRKAVTEEFERLLMRYVRP